jgi:hypothetical protein
MFKWIVRVTPGAHTFWVKGQEYGSDTEVKDIVDGEINEVALHLWNDSRANITIEIVNLDGPQFGDLMIDTTEEFPFSVDQILILRPNDGRIFQGTHTFKVTGDIYGLDEITLDIVGGGTYKTSLTLYREVSVTINITNHDGPQGTTLNVGTTEYPLSTEEYLHTIEVRVDAGTHTFTATGSYGSDGETLDLIAGETYYVNLDLWDPNKAWVIVTIINIDGAQDATLTVDSFDKHVFPKEEFDEGAFTYPLRLDDGTHTLNADGVIYGSAETDIDVTAGEFYEVTLLLLDPGKADVTVTIINHDGAQGVTLTIDSSEIVFSEDLDEHTAITRLDAGTYTFSAVGGYDSVVGYGSDSKDKDISSGGDYEITLDLLDPEKVIVTVNIINFDGPQGATLSIDSNVIVFTDELDEHTITRRLDPESYTFSAVGGYDTVVGYGSDSHTHVSSAGGEYLVELELWDSDKVNVTVTIVNHDGDQPATLTYESMEIIFPGTQYSHIEYFRLVEGIYSFTAVGGYDDGATVVEGYGVDTKIAYLIGGNTLPGHKVNVVLDLEKPWSDVWVKVTNHGAGQYFSVAVDGVDINFGMTSDGGTGGYLTSLTDGSYVISATGLGSDPDSLDPYDYGYWETTLEVDYDTSTSYTVELHLWEVWSNVTIHIENLCQPQNATIYIDGVYLDYEYEEFMPCCDSDPPWNEIEVYLRSGTYNFSAVGSSYGHDYKVREVLDLTYDVYLNLNCNRSEINVYVANNGPAQNGDITANGERLTHFSSSADEEYTLKKIFKVTPGSYEIIVTGDDFGEDSETVTAIGGMSHSLYLDLSADVHIWVANHGPAQNADIFADDTLIGTYPCDENSDYDLKTTFFLPEGAYTFKVEGEDCARDEVDVIIIEDTRIDVYLTLWCTDEYGVVNVAIANEGPGQEASVSIDGVEWGTVTCLEDEPYDLKEQVYLSSGWHYITVEGLNFGMHREVVLVEPGEYHDLFFDLSRPTDEFITIHVSVQNNGPVQFADLTVDGELIGTITCFENDPQIMWRTLHLEPGHHTIAVEGHEFGWDDVTRLYASGETVSLYLNLWPPGENDAIVKIYVANHGVSQNAHVWVGHYREGLIACMEDESYLLKKILYLEQVPRTVMPVETYHIMVKGEDYGLDKQMISVFGPGDVQEVYLDLHPPYTMGTIEVILEDTGPDQEFDVYIDEEAVEKYKMMAPLPPTPFGTYHLPAGNHSFRVSGDDYGWDHQNIEIKPGENYRIHLGLHTNDTEVIEEEREEFADGTIVNVKAGFMGGGGLFIENVLESPNPNERNDIDIMFNVTSMGGDISWVYTEVAIGSWPTPEWPEPENLRLHYWDELAEEWVMTEASGVDLERGVVWGYSTHLTTFSVQEVAHEPEDQKEGEEGLGSLGMLILFMVFMIILLPLSALMVRKI